MNDKAEFDFKCLNPVKFELIFTFKYASKIMRMAIEKSKPKLKEKGIDANKMKYDAIQKWPVDVRFYNLIKTGIKSFVGDVAKQVKKDGIILLSYEVSKVLTFKKSHTEYVTEIYLTGDYSEAL